MIERLFEQRIAELEFRVQTLERATLELGNRVAKLEQFVEAGAKRFLTAILAEKGETRQ